MHTVATRLTVLKGDRGLAIGVRFDWFLNGGGDRGGDWLLNRKGVIGVSNCTKVENGCVERFSSKLGVLDYQISGSRD